MKKNKLLLRTNWKPIWKKFLGSTKAREVADIQTVENILDDILAGAEAQQPQRVKKHTQQLETRMPTFLDHIKGNPALKKASQDAYNDVVKKSNAVAQDPTNEGKISDLRNAIARAKVPLAESKVYVDPGSTDRPANLELQKALAAIADVRDADKRGDRGAVQDNMGNAKVQIQNAIRATAKLAQNEKNPQKRDNIRQSLQHLGQLQADCFDPSISSNSPKVHAQSSQLENAIEDVLDNINGDNHYHGGHGGGSEPSSFKPSGKNDFEDFVSNVANTIAEKGKQYECTVATELSQSLSRLAQCAREGKKQEMIQQAKAAALKINELVRILRLYAAQLGKNHSERVLQDRLIQAAQSLQNNATQLKILTSVKAASQVADKDTDESLSSIINGIGQHVSEGLFNMDTSERTIFKKKLY